MGGFMKGDIVVLNFPFSDLSATKRRPALVISDLEGDDVILCQITSNSKTDGYSIKIDAEDYTKGKLSVESVIRPNKIFTADKSIILYTACKISNEKTDIVIKSIINIMNPNCETDPVFCKGFNENLCCEAVQTMSDDNDCCIHKIYYKDK